ncbi:MAG: hypothetical protein R3C10_13550 [Pirellulales bacterium]|nr:hypothetical protein [Planctomycetales bacterium]
MEDDTDFEFEFSTSPATPESPPVSAGVLPSAGQPSPGGTAPTHHFHTQSGKVTVVAHDVMAALIAALADVHRNSQ